MPRLEERAQDDGNSADCERGFSLQNNLKNCQRNRLLPERLDTLVVISAEGSPLQEFQFVYALRLRNHKGFFFNVC